MKRKKQPPPATSSPPNLHQALQSWAPTKRDSLHIAIVWDYLTTPVKEGFRPAGIKPSWRRTWNQGKRLVRVEGEIVCAFACGNWESQPAAQITTLLNRMGFDVFSWTFAEDESAKALTTLQEWTLFLSRRYDINLWLVVTQNPALSAWVQWARQHQVRVILVAHRTRQVRRLLKVVDHFLEVAPYRDPITYLLSSEPSSPSEGWLRRLHFSNLQGMADYYQSRQDYTKSIALYHQALKLAPGSEDQARVHLNLAYVHEDCDQNALALLYYQMALVDGYYRPKIKETVLDELDVFLRSLNWDRATRAHFIAYLREEAFHYVPHTSTPRKVVPTPSYLVGHQALVRAIRQYVAPLLGLAPQNISFAQVKRALRTHPIFGRLRTTMNGRVKKLLASLNWTLHLKDFWQGIYDA